MTPRNNLSFKIITTAIATTTTTKTITTTNI
jgi:hypothetical protein